MKNYSLLVLLGSAAFGITTISGCAQAIGPSVNGALVITDPRPVKTVASDEELEQSLNYHYAMSGKYHDLEVMTYDHKVLLTGRVNTNDDKAQAVKIAENDSGVTRVYDYLVVENAKEYQGSTTNDSYITAKVKSDFLATSGVSSNDTKIKTTAGVVYIFAKIPKAQAEKIYTEAKSISGVKRVEMLVEYQKNGSWF